MGVSYVMEGAPHNFYGHVASTISAHFCAAVSNFRIMEIDIDGVPWRDDIVDHPPVFENGALLIRSRQAVSRPSSDRAAAARPDTFVSGGRW